ncbi:hydrogenase expression/formation protein HypE [Amycolatopsis umgeniensis]|uniref:Hydrogenase expression/formation protein HypE n=1 Tax=Amycolatopsis umgeniensis TaxID=336628 RepID=A0A841AU68_9PSEU|nr:hydrogenase expression/formation protein HypE [Amycolatopsis umgeniensis]MBB5849925.1 hydrogenase expression/formation protein HypE [Amycolatopsis umgeniensis]
MASSVTGLDEVVLDHGSGAKLSGELISFVVETLGEVYIGEMEDSAMLSVPAGRIAMTTDSFVADPPFFGNGDIGKISVCGTVNDLAVVGARPLYLTLGMILETGLPMALLHQVCTSIRETALEAGVQIVCGDTKVVRKGEVDQIYLNTAGIGVFERAPLRMRDVRPGDRVILSGPIGNHTVHLLSIREGLGFEQRVLSDCAPLNGLMDTLLTTVGEGTVHSVRDVTRGGLAAVLHEYARASGHAVRFEQERLPIQFETVMATDMLGINAIHAANEGCLCLFVDPAAEQDVLNVLRSHKYGAEATTIGEVTGDAEPLVLMRGADGRDSVVEELQGAELPRLC